MGYEIRCGHWQGPSASFYFMTVFCQGLYIGALKCRGSIIVYIPGVIGYQVADTGPVGWVNFWPGCSLVPKY